MVDANLLTSDELTKVPASEPAPAPAPESAPPAPDTTAPDAQPPAEPPAPEVDDESDADIEAKAQTNEPNLLDLRAPRGQRIYRSYKAYKGMTDALGFEPAIDDISAWHSRFVDTEMMESDFTSGQPEALARFAQNWQEKSPQGMEAMAHILPNMLAQMNPQAYMRMATPIVQRYEAALYQRASQSADPELKKALWHAAQVLEWDRTGKFKPEPAAGAPAQPAADDSLAERERLVHQRWQEVQQATQEQQRTQFNSWRSSTNSAIDDSVAQIADEALAPLKSQYANDPLIFDALKDRFIRTVHDRVQKNAEGLRQFDVRYERAVRTQSDADRTDLVRLYSAMARRAAQAHRADLLKSATKRVVEQNAAQHQQLAQGATRVAPTTAGAPPSHSIVPQLPQGASNTERMDAMIDAIMR